MKNERKFNNEENGKCKKGKSLKQCKMRNLARFPTEKRRRFQGFGVVVVTFFHGILDNPVWWDVGFSEEK